MRQTSRSIAGLALLILLLGCDQATMLKKFTPPADEAAARHYVDLLRQRKFEEIEKNVASMVNEPDIPGTLESMANLFPQGEALSSKVVGSHWFRQDDLYRSNITLEYQFPDRWLLVAVEIETRDGVGALRYLHVQQMPQSLEEANRFTLVDKGPTHYMVLLLAVMVGVLSLYTFVLCLRTKIRRKWLWALLTLVGVGRFGIDWTTGHTLVSLFFVTLPSAGVAGSLYGPWVVYFTLPAGSLLFLALRTKLMVAASPALASPLPPTSDGIVPSLD